MAWSTPLTWVDDSTPTNAVNLNAQIRDNMVYLKAAVDSLQAERDKLKKLRPWADRSSFGGFTIQVTGNVTWKRLGDTRYFDARTTAQCLWGYAINIARSSAAALQDFEFGMAVNGVYREGIAARGSMQVTASAGGNQYTYFRPKDLITLNYFESLTPGLNRMYPVVRSQDTGTKSFTFGNDDYFVQYCIPIPDYADYIS